MLNSKQRAELRAQSNDLDTTLMVGKGGVTEAVIAGGGKPAHRKRIGQGEGPGRGPDVPPRGQRCHL